MTTTYTCCFASCGKTATQRLGREVFYPMCEAHAATFALPAQGTRRCAAWLDCGHLEVPVRQLSGRGFCADCEATALDWQLLECAECGHQHWTGSNYTSCPIDGCDCEGQL